MLTELLCAGRLDGKTRSSTAPMSNRWPSVVVAPTAGGALDDPSETVAALDLVPHLFVRLGANNRYVFPSSLSRDRLMSENNVNNALRRLGCSNREMTGGAFAAWRVRC
jgi:hypothetical protein